MRIQYSPSFLRSLKKLTPGLLEEVKEKLEQFADKQNHKALKVHKLSGKLKDQYSFSVNFETRIVFYYISKKDERIFLTAIGSHDVYKK